MLLPGHMATLTVARKTNFGYFLTDGTEDILLHKREATRELELDEKVEVFLYHDHQKRIAATMEEPLITFGEIAWLEVVSVLPRDGLFLNNGISRDLFLSIDELPFERERWPKPGDRLPVSLINDKKGRVMAQHIKGPLIEKQAKKATELSLNQEVTGTVYHFVDEGVFLLTEEGYLAFLHESESSFVPRLGQQLTVRVTYVRDDGRINVSAFADKMKSQVEDSEKILEYMKSRDGAMPYGDKSQAEDITTRFNMSKAAFKRALGKLMKEQLVYQKEGWTYLKEKQ
ncbi:S1 RNA-binding domain-containing protein [Bacillus alkalicellulosilyticus]|uniref:CvfB family protein n=1 Tax=Alkalihalobacterium alkalicellulosilyticum TaxID=1912214 RepID=UPI0011173E76|nr:S1-like domain-containing RNA-binding protein [Bacillus alkalicellulosilyticus]